jgi:hypothetical protein
MRTDTTIITTRTRMRRLQRERVRQRCMHLFESTPRAIRTGTLIVIKDILTTILTGTITIIITMTMGTITIITMTMTMAMSTGMRTTTCLRATSP